MKQIKNLLEYCRNKCLLMGVVVICTIFLTILISFMVLIETILFFPLNIKRLICGQSWYCYDITKLMWNELLRN